MSVSKGVSLCWFVFSGKKNFGYYTIKNPFGKKGDYITSPIISKIFSEIITIWLIKSWEVFGKPQKFNLVELGPGNGSLMETIVSTSKNFNAFYDSTSFFLYEKSNLLKQIQKKKINNKKVKWISNFSKIGNGPVIFIGNEFFDAIPVKQFVKKKHKFYEKHVKLIKNKKILHILKISNKYEIKKILSYKSFNNSNFIEFPKKGLEELEKVVAKIKKNKGGVLLIDYGYLGKMNKSTLQSVKSHRKNSLNKNLGNADITSLVNFTLLKEFFLKRNMKIKNIVSQGFFLKKMGILLRANNLSKTMSFKDKAKLYTKILRLVDEKFMGELFKVIFAYNNDKTNFSGFE